jgi:hypothetical protein
VDETRLPDGPEVEPDDETLEVVNERLAAVPADAGITMEAILMDW